MARSMNDKVHLTVEFLTTADRESYFRYPLHDGRIYQSDLYPDPFAMFAAFARMCETGLERPLGSPLKTV